MNPIREAAAARGLMKPRGLDEPRGAPARRPEAGTATHPNNTTFFKRKSRPAPRLAAGRTPHKMVETQKARILEHVGSRHYQPGTVDELCEAMKIPDGQRDAFREAIDRLLDEGHVVAGTEDTIALPPPGDTMTGTLRRHEKGFGFLQPDTPTEHGDLFIPPGQLGDAMTGDRVRAKVVRERGRGGDGSGKSPFVGRIEEVLERAEKSYAGTLISKDTAKGKKYGVLIDGRMFTTPVLVRDISAKNAKEGDKVVVELTEYPDDRGADAEGVITEVLGEAGEPDVETLATMRAFGLAEDFPDEVVKEARAAAKKLTKRVPKDRENLTKELICTIDPPDAKDYDDAISLKRIEGTAAEIKEAGYPRGAAYELGVHIADVAAYVEPGGALDQEAYSRGNSTYLPRRVVPMLPEVLSNGVCSLMEGVNRFAKSCFIVYDKNGKVLSRRFSKSVIKSAKRLTYLEAQALIDDDLKEARRHAKEEPKYPRKLIACVKLMDELARIIRKRRFADGMIVLGLPSVELEFDETGRVVDAHPEDDAFTHTIIEMFMVEANEAAARVFSDIDVPMIRRTHPDPKPDSGANLQNFARVAGFNIPEKPTRHELRDLLEKVRNKPGQHAVHMAVLKTLSKAEYSPQLVGHFALASEHYTHFTSPIRRYPDFVVHRSLNALIEATETLSAGKKRKPTKKAIAKAVSADDRVPDEQELRVIGQHCSTTERNSESAERQLRQYLVMELLSEKLGEDFDGTITGITGQGVFMQVDRYLVDGFISVHDLPGGSGGRSGGGGGGNKGGRGRRGGTAGSGDRWQLNRQTGALVAQRSGKVMNIGDRFTVRIVSVDLPRRQLELAIIDTLHSAVKRVEPSAEGETRGGRGPSGHNRDQDRHRDDAKPGKKRKRGGPRPERDPEDEIAAERRSKRNPDRPAPAADTRGGRDGQPGGAEQAGGGGKKKRRRGRGGKKNGAHADAPTPSAAGGSARTGKKKHRQGTHAAGVVIKQRRHRGRNKRK